MIVRLQQDPNAMNDLIWIVAMAFELDLSKEVCVVENKYVSLYSCTIKKEEGLRKSRVRVGIATLFPILYRWEFSTHKSDT